MLPRTRRAQFLDCFKMNYIVLLKCGLMLLLFFAPLIIFSMFMDLFFDSLMAHAIEEIEQTKMIFYYLYNGGLILLSLIAIMGLTGIIHVLRNLIWGEGIFFKDDFSSGIKQNISKNLIFGVIFGLFYGLAFFVYYLFRDNFISLFGILLFALVFLPIYFWIMLLNNTYNSRVGGLLRNGLYFYTKNIGWSLLGILMPLSLVGLLFIPFVWLKYIALVLVVVFVYPIMVLIMVLYSTAKFDASINKDQYPDYYLRGLNDQ